MANNTEKLDLLLSRLDGLVEKQEYVQQEIQALRREIDWLKLAAGSQAAAPGEAPVAAEPPAPLSEQLPPSAAAPQQPPINRSPFTKKPAAQKASPIGLPHFSFSSKLEKYIGENLISKIGIAILVIGVGIGAKYAIDHELVSPLTRIVLGYLAGIGLLGFALKLKKDYPHFSAVLLSGAMAILYFITYAAYDFYGLLPQVVAFGLMVVFTAFTVVAALQYNLQLIAHFGLVGAYAVPLLLSDGSGRVAILFTYMSILNAGILLISFRRQWKPLVYTSFALSWLVFLGWFSLSYSYSEPNHFAIAFVFAGIFFLLFYTILLAYKLLQHEQFLKDDVLLLLLNAFFFYGVGYVLLQDYPQGEELLGLYTLGNALLHFGVAVLIYRRRLADRNLFYLLAGLVLVFITLAVPVQLEGHWVSLLWAFEAALLFWIGRTRGVKYYESLAYALMGLAFGSMAHDWMVAYEVYDPEGDVPVFLPVFNTQFLLTLLFAAAFGFMTWLNLQKPYSAAFPGESNRRRLLEIGLPAVFLFSLYQLFRLEIELYWDHLYQASEIRYLSQDPEQVTLWGWNSDLLLFKRLWIMGYSVLFFTILSFVNLFRIESRELGLVNLVFNVLALLVFLWGGLLALSELRESYVSQHMAEYYERGLGHVLIRYMFFVLIGGLLYATYHYIRAPFMQLQLRKLFDVGLHVVVLWILSSELIHWMDLSGATQTYKFGLSILWGVYALLLIALGIWKNKKWLRIGAIALFAVTLIKLFAYDIVHLDTIAKTVVFVSLGMLLLIISFLYNKYKTLIFDEPNV